MVLRFRVRVRFKPIVLVVGVVGLGAAVLKKVNNREMYPRSVS